VCLLCLPPSSKLLRRDSSTYSIPPTTLTSPFAHEYPQPSRYEWIDLPLASEPFIGLHVLSAAFAHQTIHLYLKIAIGMPFSTRKLRFPWHSGVFAKHDACSPQHIRICAEYVSSALTASPSKRTGGNRSLPSPQCHSAGDLVVRSDTTQRGSHTLHHDAVA
jgi:hypothetical protein